VTPPLHDPLRRRALTTLAATAAAVALPVGAQSDPMPELVGLGGVLPTPLVRLHFWGFEVYDARLWTRSGFDGARYAQHPFALELQYLRRLAGSAIASRSLDEMRRLADIDEARAQRWLQAMRALFPDVQRGDRLTGVHRPGLGARFWHNGQARGEVAEPEFSTLFFGIWLDPRTVKPSLRQGLLAGVAP